MHVFILLPSASRDILKSALERAEVTTQEENVKILSQLPADQQSIFNGLETSYKRQQFYKKQFDLVVSGSEDLETSISLTSVTNIVTISHFFRPLHAIRLLCYIRSFV